MSSGDTSLAQDSKSGSFPVDHGSAGSGPRVNSTLLVLFLAAGSLAFAVLQSLVSPALPAIGKDLHATTAASAWVLTAYLLSASVLTPILGRLGDMLGKRRMLIVVLSLLVAGTLLAAVAPNLGTLVVARILQGAAGGTGSLSYGILRDEMPPEKVSVSIGLMSAITGVGVGVGIVAAGPIVQLLSWHWLFWFPLVLEVVALVGVIVGIPETPVRRPGRLDVVGALVVSTGLVAVLLAITEGEKWGWGSVKTIGLLAFGALTLVIFVFAELRTAEPLIDMRLFRLRGVWTANLVAMIFGFAMFGTFVIVPNLLQLPSSGGYGFGATVSVAGLFLLPTVVAMTIFGPLAGIMVRRFGTKPPMLLGSLLVTAAFVLPAVSHAHLWQILVSGALSGAGIGLAFASTSNAIVASVPVTQTAQASGVNSIARTIGSSVSTAVIAALLSSQLTAQGLPRDSAFTMGFWACAGVGALAILASIAAPSRRRV